MGEEVLKLVKRYRWVIFWILAFGYAFVYFHRLAPAVVAVDMMQDLRAGGGLLGLLGAAYFYAYAFMQLPAGLLSDSWGPRKTISLFFIVAFAGSVLLGLAANIFLAILGRTLVGLGVAMLFVPTMKVFAEWYHVSEFALMTGIFMAMGGIGSLCAATPMALMSAWIGWRLSFIVMGILTLILGLLVWLFVRDRPSDLGWISPAAFAGAKLPAIGLVEGMKTVSTALPFWILSLWFFFDASVFFAFIGLWGGPYLMQIYGLTKSQAGFILSTSAIGMVIGSPLLGYFSDRVLRARKPVIIASSSFLVAISSIFAFFTADIPLPGLYLLCFGLGIFSFGITTVVYAANKELFPVQIAGTASGLVNFFPFAGGAIFQPLLGYILESQGKMENAFVLQGYKYAFLALFLCAVAALLFSLFIKETLKNK